MEIKLLDIVSEKTSNPRQLADLEELRLYALAVIRVEEQKSRESGKHLLSEEMLEEIGASSEAKGRVFGLQSRFCRRADSASEAVESIVGFEREELEFLHLLSNLATQGEQSRLQSLIRTKEQLVLNMELFVDNWKMPVTA